MKILINNCDIELAFDLYGTMYFEHGDKQYQVNMTNDSGIGLEEGDYHVLDKPKLELHKFVSKEDDKLKEEVKKDLELEDGEPVYNYEDTTHYMIGEGDFDPDTYEQLDLEAIEKYGRDNHKFVFSQYHDTDEKIRIEDRHWGDITSLYETFVYDNNRLLFKACAYDETSVFRVDVFVTGLIFVRPIGSKPKVYQLSIYENSLVANEQKEN